MKTHDIKHHLSKKLLMAYSAGQLEEGFALAIATHISMCDQCRAELESLDAMGGAIIENLEPNEIGSDAFLKTLALIDQTPYQAHERPKQKSLPEPLADYVGCDLDDIDWRPIGMGVKQKILVNSEKVSARLLYIPAGTAVPEHSHKGRELTLVLKGAFKDEFDYFGPGDVEFADGHTHHTPVASDDEDCICLAVTDAPLKFNKLIHKIAQPFLKI
jgi:putative transcriptional regulator